MIALGPRLELSFTQGLLAAINPCGFVLLPTYLLYFLGMENLRPGAERASLRRALLVGGAVSAGFMLVFTSIGVLSKWVTNWFTAKSAWVSLVIGLGLVVLGIAMLFGYRLPFTTPKLDVGQRDRSVRSMFVFGIAYAVASIGCTIGPFSAVVLGAFSTSGVVEGVTAIALYGAGMALIVVSLTVSLASANTAVLRFLRGGMAWFEHLAAAFVLLTGLYLSWYWYSSLTDSDGGQVIDRAETWQTRLRSFVEGNQTVIVVLAAVVIAAAIVGSLTLRRTRPQRA